MQWSRRQVTVGCAALMAGLLVGCERRPPERPDVEIEDLAQERPSWMPPAAPTTGDLRTMLTRRADALMQGDEQAFLADLDPANERLVDRQRMVFTNLRQLELDEFRFATGGIVVGVPDDDGNSLFAPVIAVIKLAIDDARAGVAPAEAFQYKLATKDERVVITDIVPVTRDNAEATGVQIGLHADAPWNTTPLEVINAGTVWLVGDDSVPDLRRYADAARAEVGEVEALWGDRTRFPGYILFFTQRTKTLRRWFGLGDDVDRLDGVEIPLQGVRKNGEVYRGEYAGARIVVNLANIERFGNDPAAVMRHELAHAVTARAGAVALGVAGLDLPRWAVEGFARWVENLERPERQAQQRAIVADGVRAGTFDDAPPESKVFYDDAAIAFNYAVSATVFSFVERTADRDTAVEFYAKTTKHLDMKGSPLVTLPAFDGVCRDVLGTGSAAFLEEWAGFVRQGA